MSELREIAYQIDPVQWVREIHGVTPMPWQHDFLRAPLGASIVVLTARQIGKTTAAAWAIAHTMIFRPGSLSVVACPAQRQSAEAVRRVRDVLLKTGERLKSDNVYGLELENGSRVLALPGSDDSIRGLTVDGWIIADEAARLTDDLIAALRPMRARRPQARFAMLSTANTRTDPFWTAWSNQDPSWIRIKATADMPGCPYTDAYLADELRALGQDKFNEEYLGIPGGSDASPFTWDLFERATRIHVPEVAPGPAFRPRGNDGLGFHPDDVRTWPGFWPLFIAHDVGRTQDRSTAVVGGLYSYAPGLLGIREFEELPQGHYGSVLASSLAAIDRKHNSNAFIIADVTNNSAYAEVLFDTFGPRLIGVHISRNGNGVEFERLRVRNRQLLVYTIGRTQLLDIYLHQFISDLVRLPDTATSRRAFEQLVGLAVDRRDTGLVYECLSGQHDDLGISCAMLAWAARHPDLNGWMRLVAPRRRTPKQGHGWGPFVAG